MPELQGWTSTSGIGWDGGGGGGLIGFGRDLVRETVRDVAGAGRVLGAALGTPFDALGLAVPITWEELEGRDWRGAAMIAAMGVGGVLGNVARGSKLLARVGDVSTALGRAKRTAVAEMVAGAGFGLVRPLDEDEARTRAVLGDAAFFGAFGAGASLAKSAVGGVVNQYRSQIAQANAVAATAVAARHVEGEKLAKEILGVRLYNPETKQFVGVRRNSMGQVASTFYDEKSKVASTRNYTDFGAAAADALKEGFSERVGLFRKRSLKNLQIADAETLSLLEQGDEGLEALLQRFQLTEYQAVREVARSAAERGQRIAALEAEAITESVDAFGMIALAPSTKLGIARAANIKGDLSRLSDADVVREGILRGAVSTENLESGLNAREWLKELFYNDLLPNGGLVTAGFTRDAFLTRFLTPRLLGKLNPEFLPVWQSASARFEVQRAGMQKVEQFLFDLESRVGRDTMNRGAKIIDEAGEAARAEVAALPEIARTTAPILAIAGTKAREAAQASGDARLSDFIESILPRLDEYLQRYIVAGRVSPEGGLAGYFPIVNGNKWKLDVGGEFKGFYPTREEATAKFQELLAQNPKLTGSIAPQSFMFDAETLTLFAPKQWKALNQAIREASEGTLSAAEIKTIANEAGIPVQAAVGLKFSPHLRKRELGLRDFSEDAYDALRIYMHNAERTLAFNDFEREAVAIIASIDPQKQNLIHFMEQYVDDVLGRPRKSEILFDNVVAALGLDVKPRSLARYSHGIRWFQSNMRLGGPWSGVINSTQFAINTFPVLGAKYTARGLEVLDPRKFNETAKLFHKHGHDLGAFVPLSAEGEIGFDSFKSVVKQGRYKDAASRVWLGIFNGAEKFNRVATARGALARELAENPGMEIGAAIERAMQVVQRTQFDYRLSNVPEILRGPVGAVLGQFKSFFINEIEFIASLNRKEALRFAIAAQAVGGLAIFANIPGADLVNGAVNMFFDRNAEEALKSAPGENAFSRYLAFGLPGLVGVDLSDVAGVGTLADVTRGILGPTANDAGTLWEFFKNSVADVGAGGTISHETMNTFVQRALPSALRRAERGYEIAQSGEVRNPYTGKLIYRPTERAQAAFLTGLGAPLIEVQQQRIMDQIATRVRDRYVRARSGYAKEAALAAIKHDNETLQKTLAEARASGFNIDGQTLRYYIKEMRRPAEERRRRRVPKELRSEMAELFEATGATQPGQL